MAAKGMNVNMKVALFAETYVPDVNGVVAHVQTLKDGLEKLGHSVMVVAADKKAKHHYVEDGVLHCPAKESKHFYGFGVALPFSSERRRIIREFDPDILHIHQEFGVGFSGLRVSRRLEKPLVYTLHTMYDQYIHYIAPKRLLKVARNFSRKYIRFIARRATVLTGPSQKCAEYFKSIGIQKEFHLIPNSADLDIFDPAKVSEEQKAAFRKQYGIPEDAFLACFCGRLGKEKSIDVLIEFIAGTLTKEDNVHLVVIGEGPDKESLQKLAQDLGISDMVTFTGLISHDNMPVCLAACDIYATASLSEMNSISMLEGMASGLAVLQRYDELNANQILVGENGYLFNTKEEMAGKIREIKALSREQKLALRQSVIGTVKSRGSTELAEYILTVYEEAIALNGAAMS